MITSDALRRGVSLVATLAAAATACGDVAPLPPTGQIVLYVDTDAPVPPAPGESLGKDEPPPLFDRLRIEFFAPGEDEPCPGCTRDFALDARALRERRASVGFVPRAGLTGYRARVRLYRAAGVAGPRPRSTLEHVLALPAVAAEGIVEVRTRVSVDDLGAPRGTLDQPIDAERGRPDATAVATWPGAVVTPCRSDPEDGMACVPGGAFWMGSLESEASESLVHLSPFAIDATEITVAAFRRSKLANGTDPSAEVTRLCFYSPKEGVADTHPVNCISKDLAAAFCTARGADLPTEAEHEYASGGRRGVPFPWGTTPPACEDAIFARGGGPDPGTPYFTSAQGARACNRLGVGPAPVKRGARDKVTFGGVDVFDLAGNLTEWAKDEGDPCWLGGGVQTNPSCTAPRPNTLHTRGGAWGDIPLSLAATQRTGVRSEPADGPNNVGFRCVRRD
ncbi:MAG: formylglycine-generating enzyme family protein [Polyangiaceae bacterium]